MMEQNKVQHHVQADSAKFKGELEPAHLKTENESLKQQIEALKKENALLKSKSGEPDFIVAPPAKFKGDQGAVRPFLRELARYFQLCKLPEAEWAKYGPALLTGEPLILWEAEEEECKAREAEVNFEHFRSLLLRYYDLPLPLRRKMYDSISQTGSVTEYVREMKRIVLELADTPLAPSEGGIIFTFIRGLKQPFQDYVEQSAPVSWWTATAPLFEKALSLEKGLLSVETTSQASHSIAHNRVDSLGVIRPQLKRPYSEATI